MTSNEGRRQAGSYQRRRATNGDESRAADPAPVASQTARGAGSVSPQPAGEDGPPAAQTRPLAAPAQGAYDGGERTSVIPRQTPAVPSGPPRRSVDNERGQGAKRPALRRVKRTLARLDLLSVLKLSLLFYAVAFLLWLGFVAIVYRVLESLGLFATIEEFVGHPGVGNTPFDITLGNVERWAALVGAAFAVLGSLANVGVAILYNIFSALFGGLEMTFIERAGR